MEDEEKARLKKEYHAAYRASHREKAREATRIWRAENPERARASTANWRKNNPEKVRAASRAYCQRKKLEIREKKREYMRTWRAANPDRVKELGRISYGRAKDNGRLRRWRLENSEKARKACREWRNRNIDRERQREREARIKNPERVQAHSEKRRARISSAAGRGLTTEEIKELKARQRHKCAMCGEKRTLTVDHIVPLSRGGEHDIKNIQMLCAPCNGSKGAADPLDYARRTGKLL